MVLANPKIKLTGVYSQEIKDERLYTYEMAEVKTLQATPAGKQGERVTQTKILRHVINLDLLVEEKSDEK